MPRLDAKQYPQAKLLEDIKAGTSFVRVVPDNIGEITFFDTTEPDAEALPDEVYRRRKLITIICTIIALTAIWVLLYSHYGWGIFLSIVAIFIGYLVHSSQEFSGVDSFIGTEGYAEYTFSNSRENIVSKSGHRFDEGFGIIHKEVRKYKNWSYQNTEYSFEFIGIPDKEGLATTVDQINDTYDCEEGGPNTGDATYDYWYRIEKQLCMNYLQAAGRMLESGQMVPIFMAFKEKGDKWRVGSIISLGPGVIQYGKKIYNQEDLKKVYINKGILYLEDANYSSKLFGLKKTGEQITIPLEMIVNRDAFLTLLSNLYVIN